MRWSHLNFNNLNNCVKHIERAEMFWTYAKENIKFLTKVTMLLTTFEGELFTKCLKRYSWYNGLQNYPKNQKYKEIVVWNLLPHPDIG